jgi:sodium transport system permease protein
MNWSDIWTVFRKEALQTLRDRNTLLIMLLGILTMPLASTITAVAVQHRLDAGSRVQARVVVHGEDAGWVIQQVPPTKDLKFSPAPANIGLNTVLQKAIASGALVLDVPKNFRRDVEQIAKDTPTLKLYVDNRRDNLNERLIADKALNDWRKQISNERAAAKAQDVAAIVDESPNVVVRSLASNADRTGATFGLLLPIEITLAILLISLYTATDLVTAERERNTLVLLAVSPPKLGDVLLGKMLVVLATVTLGTLLTILMQLGLLAAFVGKAADMAGTFPLTIPFPAALLVLPVTLPLIIFLTAISLTVGAYSRNFQQAQSYASLLLIVCMIPSSAALLPTSDYPPLIAAVPIANTALAIRDLLSGQLTWQFATGVLLSSCMYAAVSIFFATKLLDSEHSVFPQDEPLGSWRASARLLGTFIAGVFLAYFVLGQTIQTVNVLYGLLASQLFIIGAPAILFVNWLRLPVRETLSLKRPTNFLVLPAAVFLAPVTVLLACCIMAAQELVLPAPKELNEMLLRILVPEGMPIWLVFVTVAAAPALCEELMFRGLMQGILIRAMTPQVVLPVTALAFGLFHMSAFRLLPTGILGLVLCYLTYRYRSIFPAMVLHLCHNAIGVVVSIYHVEPFTMQNLVIVLLSGAVAAALLLLAERRQAV